MKNDICIIFLFLFPLSENILFLQAATKTKENDLSNHSGTKQDAVSPTTLHLENATKSNPGNEKTTTELKLKSYESSTSNPKSLHSTANFTPVPTTVSKWTSPILGSSEAVSQGERKIKEKFIVKVPPTITKSTILSLNIRNESKIEEPKNDSPVLESNLKIQDNEKLLKNGGVPSNSEITTSSSFDFDTVGDGVTKTVFIEPSEEQTTTLVNSESPYANDGFISKCCQDDQFFNLSSQMCERHTETSLFGHLISNLLYETELLQWQTSLISACSLNDELPSMVSDISNDTFVILHTGELFEISTEVPYNSLEYCLELGGFNLKTLSLTLIFCPKNVEYDEPFEYDSHLQTLPIPNGKNTVRKCCRKSEYYDSTFHKCTVMNDPMIFDSYIQELTFDDLSVNLEIFSSRIQECPDNAGPPTVLAITDNQYKLLNNGALIEITSGIQYHISHYCLELVGPNRDELTFTMAFCPQTISVQKCCPMNKYFDEIDLNCRTMQASESSRENILQVFVKDFRRYFTVPMREFLSCHNTFPTEEPADHFVIEDGQLCNPMTCFDNKDYCIEYIGKASEDLEPTAFYCEKEFFIKCCQKDHVLSEQGCVKHEGRPSILLQQLQNTKSFTNTFDSLKCEMGRGIFLDDSLSAYVRWWISKDGRFLTVKSDVETMKLGHYCVDDYLNSDQTISTGAFVCEDAVDHIVPKDKHFLSVFEGASLGKCCPFSTTEGSIYYYSQLTGNCEIALTNVSLVQDTGSVNYTNIYFRDFPMCQNEQIEGYSAYPLQPGPHDYAIVAEDGILKVVSHDGKCVQREDFVKDGEYCIEYIMSETGKLTTSAFVCSYETVTDFFSEKFTLVTSLLGISCVCLLVTLYFLFTMRVRRGLVTVRKVNTLAGRILVSFVVSHFLGFIALALTQHRNLLNQTTSYGCYVIAGMVQFFNLATFCWNTSICLESLLLTFHITISECLRYILHSLWAWGIPFVMTIFMFVMDFYREEFSCTIVTPKIGISGCFLKDANAIMLYFRLPILLTLLANVSLLILAKSMRKARLRRLETGNRRKTKKSGTRSETIKAEENGPVQTGMRTHQNKNITVESMRIVFWTGGLWFAELAGFFIHWHLFPQKNVKWYRYLWYIPTSLNALRGVGVFVIVVLTPEMRKKIKLFLRRSKRPIIVFLQPLCWWSSDKRVRQTSSSTYAENSSSRNHTFHDKRRRNMSVVTMISNLSSSFHSSSLPAESTDNSVRKASVTRFISSKLTSLKQRKSIATDQLSHQVNSINGNKPSRKSGIIRSVSQFDQPTTTSGGYTQEELETITNCVTKKYSSNTYTMQLPKLPEEDNLSVRSKEDSKTNSTETIQKEIVITKNSTKKNEETNLNNFRRKSEAEESEYQEESVETMV